MEFLLEMLFFKVLARVVSGCAIAKAGSAHIVAVSGFVFKALKLEGRIVLVQYMASPTKFYIYFLI